MGLYFRKPKRQNAPKNHQKYTIRVHKSKRPHLLAPKQAPRYTRLLSIFTTESHKAFFVNLNDLSSDHTPILLTTFASTDQNPPHPSLSQGPIKWDKFSEIIQSKTYLNISLKNNEDIENAAQDIVTSIQSAVFESSYPKNKSYKINTNNQSLPANIVNLISEKRRVRSKWQKYHYPSDKKLFNHLANTIKKLILKQKSDFFVNKYQSSNQKDGSLWYILSSNLSTALYLCHFLLNILHQVKFYF